MSICSAVTITEQHLRFKEGREATQQTSEDKAAAPKPDPNCMTRDSHFLFLLLNGIRILQHVHSRIGHDGEAEDEEVSLIHADNLRCPAFAIWEEKDLA